MENKNNLEEIEKFQDEYMEKYGDEPISQFEGLSANQMTYLVEDFFDENSPIKIYKEISQEVLDTIPLLQLVKYYLNLIVSEGGSLKLTAAGYIPPKQVKEIYETGFIVDPYVESGEIKINKELDSMVVELVKLLSFICKITVEEKGKIIITDLGKELLKNERDLLEVILKGYTKEFNWSYFDLCGENQDFQSHVGYIVYLLKKFGRKKLPMNLYTKKFITAFPAAFEDFISVENENISLEEKEKDFEFVMYLRAFERFLGYFNLVDVSLKGNNVIMITKSNIFDSVIEFTK
ncbi:hypothetical protein H3N56_09955 [Cetobacterium sp. 2A]|uniref:hypothetical protein n=1 Tax=Cetobacterium sp. 2A TaxID=2754723 RepID=UPI00163CD1E5|nr:hypothetical protein [Cetobacterium sp. 2A]MBC2856764.1 hypothetical protein [Cetobacterium sp. 2A]